MNEGINDHEKESEEEEEEGSDNIVDGSFLNFTDG